MGASLFHIEISKNSKIYKANRDWWDKKNVDGTEYFNNGILENGIATILPAFLSLPGAW